MRLGEFFSKLFGFINQNFKVVVLILILLFLFLPSTTPKQEPNLMRIDITGVIQDASAVLDSIQIAKNTESIKGVLLFVDSPGGSVAPSVEIYLAVKDLKKTKKVVAYASGTMASGSYYASSTADYIIANPGSMIGSIGVIASVPNIEELSKKIGISEQVVKAGDFKEAGTMTRKWTKEERASLQEMVDDIYELFVNDVVDARGLDIKRAKEFANARVFIAHKAQKLGLIDEVGNINSAKEYLIKEAKIKDPVWKEPDIVDKIIKRIGVETKSQILDVFYGVKIQ